MPLPPSPEGRGVPVTRSRLLAAFAALAALSLPALAQQPVPRPADTPGQACRHAGAAPSAGPGHRRSARARPAPESRPRALRRRRARRGARRRAARAEGAADPDRLHRRDEHGLDRRRPLRQRDVGRGAGGGRRHDRLVRRLQRQLAAPVPVVPPQAGRRAGAVADPDRDREGEAAVPVGPDHRPEGRAGCCATTRSPPPGSRASTSCRSRSPPSRPTWRPARW